MHTQVKAFNVQTLNTTHFVEAEIPFDLPVAASGDWIRARHHHVDLLRLGEGRWIAAVDGDSRT